MGAAHAFRHFCGPGRQGRLRSTGGLPRCRSKQVQKMAAAGTRRWSAITLEYRLAPLLGAMCYPLFLESAYAGMQRLPGAHAAQERVAAILMVAASLAAAFAVPLVAALAAGRIARSFAGSRADIGAYRLAHAVFAVPPLYTAVGVMTDVLGIGPLDFLIWVVLWSGLGLAAARATKDVRPGGEGRPGPSARAVAVHGSIALAVLLIFLLWHLGNHALALWSPALHGRAMHLLEHIYRASAVEPLLLLAMALLVATGLRLAWRHTALQGDGYRRLQTLTGFYLAAFVVSHLMAILVLARWQGHVNTGTWAYESAAPDGFLGDPWNPRLLPHYCLVVWVVITHVGLGLRGVLRAHGVADGAANLVARGASVAGAAMSLAVSCALLGVHLATF